MRTLISLLTCLSGFTGIAQSEVIRGRMSLAPVRPYLFTDDNYAEVMDRTKALPSQAPRVGSSIPSDPREYLLKDQVRQVNGELEEAYNRAMLEWLEDVIVPEFSKILRADFGTLESPLAVIQGALLTSTRALKKELPKIEEALSLPAGKRMITVLVAPWDKEPLTGENANKIWKEKNRYAPRQLGFNSWHVTPTRDYAAKHFLRDEEQGEVLSFGRGGNLLNRIYDLTERATAAVLADSPNNNEFYAVPPYAYPIAFTVSLEIEKGNSDLRVQALLGLQPLRMKLNPTSRSPEAEIGIVGISESKPRTEQDTVIEYPLVLATYEQDLRQELKTVPFHVKFGVTPYYHHFLQRLDIDNENGGWRITPYLEGHALKAGFRIPVKIHIASMNVELDPATHGARVSDIDTAIDVTLVRGLRLSFEDGKAADQASREIQTAANQMIAQSIADAETRGRAEALKRFPIAALYLNGK